MTHEFTVLDTPLGTAHALVRGGRLCGLELATMRRPGGSLAARAAALAAREAADPGRVRTALGRYFAGDLDALEALDVDPDGTRFQRRVWTALRAIPAGSTASYGAIARAIGAPTAARAVGSANRMNPIWIVVPCHRVIGASGDLTGYAGGLDAKRWLLAHERACAASAAHEARM